MQPEEIRYDPKVGVHYTVGDLLGLGNRPGAKAVMYRCIKDFEFIETAKALNFDLGTPKLPPEELAKFNQGLIQALLNNRYIAYVPPQPDQVH